MSKVLIIKLGGAVVTYKASKIPKARISIIRRLAKEVKKLIDKSFQIILVHGAGSFAHPLVKKYHLQKGMKTAAQKLIFGRVTNNMVRLNSIIIDELVKAEVKAVSLVPHTFIVQSAGKLNYIALGMIKRYISNNQVPVLFGDLVLDDKWDCSVLSGDTIVTYLANKLQINKVIFLTDVDGIFDSDPYKNPSAKKIKEINNSNIDNVLKCLTPTGRDDVTGEMYGKILEIKKKHLKNIEVRFVNGLQGNLLRAIRGDRNGTKLLLQ